jgi:GWxTD domain-containing protein
MKKLTSLIIIISSFLLFPQIAKKEGASAFHPKEKFFVDAVNFKSDEEGKTRIDVFVQVPYDEIQFVKTSQGFTGSLQITVSIFNQSKSELILERVWNEKIDSDDFEATISQNTFNLSLRSFNLTPGNYLLRSEVEDKDSRKSHFYENPLLVRDLSGEISVSDMIFVGRQTSLDAGSKIVPNISRNLITQSNGVTVFYEIYSSSDEQLKIDYYIQDNEQKEIYKEEVDQQISSGKNQIVYSIKNIDIGLGSYLLAAAIKNSEGDLLTSISKTFTSRWAGLPSTIKDLDKAIAQMRYIASSKEIDHISSAPDREEKVKRYLEFWKKKDPTPQSESNPIFEEYYRRVAYANENFTHYFEGWRTDRGMVYIILGAPSNINRHPFEYDRKPYEVWEYYELNKSFVFMDETGFGDYRLITPLHGEFSRFR